VQDISGMNLENSWNYENAFYWFSHPSRLDKALAQYELYKRIVGLPGDVIELGVNKSASFVRFGTFRRLLETDTSRNLIGFDAFGAFPHSDLESTPDSDFIRRFEEVGGDGLSEEQVHAVLAHKGFSNYELVAGDILQTVPQWLRDNPATQVALVHIDTDVYAPAHLALDLLWSRVVPGGILMLDDYGIVEGETRAVNEFIQDQGLRIEKIPYYKIPSFIVKQ
jgi:hypothetical protein